MKTNQALTNEPKPEPSDTQKRIDRATELFLRHNERIRDIAGFVTHNEDAADELIQDFYVSLTQKPLPEGIRDINGYLYRTLHRRASKQRKTAARYQGRLQHYAGLCQKPKAASDATKMIEHQEEVTKIYRIAEEKLTNRQFEAIQLRYTEGRPHKEAAKQLGLTALTFKKYVSLGIARLRKFTYPLQESSL